MITIIIWFLIQIIIFIYASKSAEQEDVGTYYYRVIGSPDYVEKLKVFHRSGLWMTTLMCVGMALTQSYLWMFPLFVVTGLWYFIKFTTKYNKRINQKWDYIGTTADSDIWIGKHFGEKGMRKLIYISGISIFILNILRILFIFL